MTYFLSGGGGDEILGMVSSFIEGSLNCGQSMTWGREGSKNREKVVTSSMDDLVTNLQLYWLIDFHYAYF